MCIMHNSPGYPFLRQKNPGYVKGKNDPRIQKSGPPCDGAVPGYVVIYQTVFFLASTIFWITRNRQIMAATVMLFHQGSVRFMEPTICLMVFRDRTPNRVPAIPGRAVGLCGTIGWQ